MNLSDHIEKYIQQRCADKLEKLEKATQKEKLALEKSAEDTDLLLQTHQDKKHVIEEQHQPVNWITDAAKRAAQICLVTHAAKFSHSDSKASGFKAQITEPDSDLVGTHSLAEPTLDVVGNAAALDVANFLLLEQNGETLWHEIKAAEGASLQKFATTQAQLSEWIEAFQQAIDATKITSHSLSKQLYFPIAANEYHLITPLHPSPLTDRIFKEIQGSRFGDGAKATRELKKKGHGAANDLVSYTELLRMNFGGSKPQNVSLLNSRRGGKAYLFHAAPPVWKEQLRLPLQGPRAFWRLLDKRANRTVFGLRKFLANKAHLPNNAAIKAERESYVTEIVDLFVLLVAEIRQLGDPGWTHSCALPLAEQCMLDPRRSEEEALTSDEFTRMLDDNSWLDTISDAFGTWLNMRLRTIKTRQGEVLDNLGDPEQHVWRQELNQRISQMRNELECLL